MTRRIFLTGGTGFLGRALIAALVERGDTAVVVSRDVERARQRLGERGDAVELVAGDPVLTGDWQQALAGCHAVINLAGQPLAGKRWSAHYKQLIHDSRVECTRYLVEGLAALPADDRPAVLVSVSGIDYYPFAVDLGAVLPVDDDDLVDERTPSGSTFLARVCRNWEAEAKEAEALGVRVALMRTGVILGRGGALDKLAGPFRFFVGGRLGSGRQWLSWVHQADVVSAYLAAVDNPELAGPINVVSPKNTRSGDFARALGRAMGRPSWLPTPGFALKGVLGEFSEYLLHGRRAVPAVLQASGFDFQYAQLDDALRQIYG